MILPHQVHLTWRANNRRTILWAAHKGSRCRVAKAAIMQESAAAPVLAEPSGIIHAWLPPNSGRGVLRTQGYVIHGAAPAVHRTTPTRWRRQHVQELWITGIKWMGAVFEKRELVPQLQVINHGVTAAISIDGRRISTLHDLKSTSIEQLLTAPKTIRESGPGGAQDVANGRGESDFSTVGGRN